MTSFKTNYKQESRGRAPENGASKYQGDYCFTKENKQEARPGNTETGKVNSLANYRTTKAPLENFSENVKVCIEGLKLTSATCKREIVDDLQPK